MVVLSAARATRAAQPYRDDVRTQQRAYTDALVARRYQDVDAGHFLHQEQPELVAAAIRKLLQP